MTTTVPESVIDDLRYMCEEEKLAGDVYDVLYERWELAPFHNIRESELFHQAEVSAQLARLGVEDGTDGLARGDFNNSTLRELYKQLVARGLKSVEEALRVAAYIEELDIADLRARRCGVREVDALYDLLEAGSHNHLRAFIINLAYIGHPYKVQVLSPEEVVAILQAGGGGCNSRACHGDSDSAHHAEGRSCF